MLNAEGSVVTGERQRYLMSFFTSVFSIKTSCPQDTQVPELEVDDQEMSRASITQEEMVSDLLCQLHTQNL